ncbi:MAG: LamG-like jellyroll fold domain-containing protein [Candidatus Pacearchaeota archaeon]|jgi:prepilin-type N-terminal cleavage/methylation domain-containing protein
MIRKAFTLIELLVVIAIIGILSGLIVVSMGGVTNRATIAKAQVFSNSLRNSLMADIVGEWKFDELTTAINGTAIQDSWITNEGTLVTDNTTTEKLSSDCVSGKCLNFDGTGDLINCGTDASVTTNLNAWTVSAWVKPNNTVTNVLIAFSSASTPAIRIMNTSGPIIYMGGSNFRYFVASAWTTLTNGNWHHVAFSIPGSGQNDITNSKMYVDGVKINTLSTTATLAQAAKTLLKISDPYSGLLDDVRIYNAEIPMSQIKEQYYSGLNKLLANGGITEEEYLSRLKDYASNN